MRAEKQKAQQRQKYNDNIVLERTLVGLENNVQVLGENYVQNFEMLEVIWLSYMVLL